MSAPDGRLSFSATYLHHQIAWDSTSLGLLKECPRKYEYNILKGHVSHGDNPHLKFGTEFHSAIENYHYCTAFGLDHDTALKSALRQALIMTWNDALGRPWASDEPTKTRETLIRSIVWYLDQFINDPCETVIQFDGLPAVELSFRFEIDLKSGLTNEPYILCGHLDRVVTFQDQRWITDVKTTKTQLSPEYFLRYSPDNQMSLYSTAGVIVFDESIAGLIVDAGQIGVTFSRFQRQPIRRTKSQLSEWLKDTELWIKAAERYATDNYWPMNDKSCGLYGGCPYRQVCGASPEIRPKLLQSLYDQRSWDPLQIRGAVP